MIKYEAMKILDHMYSPFGQMPLNQLLIINHHVNTTCGVNLMAGENNGK